MSLDHEGLEDHDCGRPQQQEIVTFEIFVFFVV
jgi:hypothetical protein